MVARPDAFVRLSLWMLTLVLLAPLTEVFINIDGDKSVATLPVLNLFVQS